VIAYGCSIIKEPLLSAFEGRFLNIHLGLSPYYRGSGTNYWPLVNNEPEYVGATFMFIDSGIDTGEVIHQIRANLVWGDMPAQIGNRLIVDMTRTCHSIVEKFDNLQRVPQVKQTDAKERIYRNRDYTEESVLTLYDNFRKGLVERYIAEETIRCNNAPIVENPSITE
jgi:methionyl-tRNA formyltransferase